MLYPGKIQSWSNYFFDYIAETRTEDLKLPHPPTCVADYIMSCMLAGDIVAFCEFNFNAFTLVLVSIADEWARNRNLNYVPESEKNPTIKRDAPGFLGAKGVEHPILDERFFNKCVADWRRRYGR